MRTMPLRASRTTVGGSPAAVEASGLTFTYRGTGRRALDGVDLTVHPGEIVALLGPSGAGKSTTQHVLTGRLRGYRGSARVLGGEISRWPVADYARLGVSFEEPACYRKLTGREQLAYFAGLSGRPARAPEEVAGALGLADALDVRTAEYSKGMRIRIDLARALQHRPEVLFLDEPTSGLDPVSAAMVREAIAAEAARGAAVLLLTHDMVAADLLADRVALMVAGRIAAAGSPRELKLRDGPALVRIEHRDGDGLHTEVLASHDPRLALLLRSGRVETVHSTEPTLADVFVAITGRHLR